MYKTNADKDNDHQLSTQSVFLWQYVQHVKTYGKDVSVLHNNNETFDNYIVCDTQKDKKDK